MQTRKTTRLQVCKCHLVRHYLPVHFFRFVFRFVPREKMTQKCDPIVREECTMKMRTDCSNLCKENCLDEDKRVCMTVPHQECQEKPVENCIDVPQTKCRKVFWIPIDVIIRFF